jgi:hypothetical protein
VDDALSFLYLLVYKMHLEKKTNKHLFQQHNCHQRKFYIIVSKLVSILICIYLALSGCKNFLLLIVLHIKQVDNLNLILCNLNVMEVIHLNSCTNIIYSWGVKSTSAYNVSAFSSLVTIWHFIHHN